MIFQKNKELSIWLNFKKSFEECSFKTLYNLYVGMLDVKFHHKMILIVLPFYDRYLKLEEIDQMLL